MNLGLWNPVTLEVDNSRLTYFSIKSDQLLKNSSKNNQDKLVRQIVLSYKNLINYSCLLEFSPEGLYIVPEYDNSSIWQGGIFVRSGLYEGSFYRFQIIINNNDDNKANDEGLIDDVEKGEYQVEFLNPPTHPLVDNVSGSLLIPKEWKVKVENNILALLFFIKNIFYLPELVTYSIKEDESGGNYEMSDCIKKDPNKAIYKIHRSVKDSIEKSCRTYNPKYSPFRLNFHANSTENENRADLEEEKLEFDYHIDDEVSSNIVDYIKTCVQSSNNINEQKEMLSEWLLELVCKKGNYSKKK
ncbi:hypothetical protein FG386_001782 [Cryptosporidium ryanae]|uniref:uncharacterized protein n=1 Tax=Cryptosporidium ryanae TaxID=515981 RepID=UPI003519E59D|nr:hypothetical protein FG386_001782 [Cryptosporidium ryanae]